MDTLSAVLLSDILGAVGEADMQMLCDIVLLKVNGIVPAALLERRDVVAGECLALLRQLTQQESRRQAALAKLTDRERDVAKLLECGLTNAAIAAALGVTVRTVRAHVAAMLDKLECPTRTALLATLLGRDIGLSANIP
ncbi:LuxR C-terminal-related transcriptional regulator [Crenobacter sp. SG2305]|uniref:LuxR family transcriptional regulator n=1 Tax=Crenobacter oryzisoli TaxID=3056844 RepID=UPI0025AB29D6|nr:LuxR C-terminal-related transcriptional regulator [Crenobacter sp. SG2305]MDN0081618.1 LuxR C-terminal-related transcriptional regulator [Crenobacter sp. SG2305]